MRFMMGWHSIDVLVDTKKGCRFVWKEKLDGWIWDGVMCALRRKDACLFATVQSFAENGKGLEVHDSRRVGGRMKFDSRDRGRGIRMWRFR